MMRGSVAMLDRALRVDSRMLRAHLLRFVFVLFIIWSAVQTQLQSRLFGAPGLNFFTFIVFLTFFLITLGGISFFSTAITEEKEEMTLGLLRMTGLSPVAILLGKGTTRLIIASLVIAIQFPFTLLAITLGGVLIHQIYATYCALGAYLLMLANVGMFLSVWCRTSRRASFIMMILLGVYFFGPWLAEMFLTASFAAGTLDSIGPTAAFAEVVLDWLNSGNIFKRLEYILTSRFNEPILSFQVISNIVVAGIFFGLSWLTFGFFNREERAASPERPFFGKRTGRAWGLAVPRAWDNALFWKDYYYMTGGKTLLAAKFLLYGLLIIFVYLFVEYTDSGFSNLPRFDILGNTAIWTSIVFFVAELCVYSSRIFREEIRWKTLSSIAILPKSLIEIVYSKWAGCLVALVPVLCYFIAGIFLSPGDFFWFLGECVDEPWFYYTLFQFILGFHVCTFLSMFMKYGSVPLTFLIMFSSFFVTVMTIELLFGFGRSEEDVVAGFLSFMSILLTMVLHVAVFFRLRVMASR